MHLDRCPTCGWPAITGRACVRCSPTTIPPLGQTGPSPTRPTGASRDRRAPATATVSRARVIVLVAVLAFVGLFWMAVAILELGGAFALGPGGVGLFVSIVAGCNLLVGGYTLAGIRAVLVRHLNAMGQLTLIAAGGACWAFAATIWFGGPFHLLILLFDIAIGMLIWMNRGYLDLTRRRE